MASQLRRTIPAEEGFHGYSVEIFSIGSPKKRYEKAQNAGAVHILLLDAFVDRGEWANLRAKGGVNGPFLARLCDILVDGFGVSSQGLPTRIASGSSVSLHKV